MHKRKINKTLFSIFVCRFSTKLEINSHIIQKLKTKLFIFVENIELLNHFYCIIFF